MKLFSFPMEKNRLKKNMIDLLRLIKFIKLIKFKYFIILFHYYRGYREKTGNKIKIFKFCFILNVTLLHKNVTEFYFMAF